MRLSTLQKCVSANSARTGKENSCDPAFGVAQ
jgi:hypothetical protein